MILLGDGSYLIMIKSSTGKPAVGIIMGSDSDWPTMKAQPTPARFASRTRPGHLRARTPRDLERYASTARERGLRVIIAGRVAPAHFPG